MLFCNENRERIKRENPEAPAKEIIKALAAEWNNLDEDLKKTYTDLAGEEKKRYQTDMEQYNKGDFVPSQKKKANEEKEVQAENNEESEEGDGDDDEEVEAREE
eukprot:TRINITY_DN4126_c0_g1_i1.p1 TRINITY_DN4126_c0_g1~~TRINITY_DN4126_c0_g1_i1.p1  ORF type:complete len:104 (+),score=40.77 TRINITY_DN4126_c0_g1_i1:449-760(+)